MAEIKILIPEIEQVLRNQERMMGMLSKLTEVPSNTYNYEEGKLMTGQEVMHYLHCGRKKMNELIAQGKIEKIGAFGTRPRYKIQIGNDAA